MFSVSESYVAGYNVVGEDSLGEITVWSTAAPSSSYGRIHVISPVTQLSLSARFLAAGFANGEVWLYDLAKALLPEKSMDETNDEGIQEFTSLAEMMFGEENVEDNCGLLIHTFLPKAAVNLLLLTQKFLYMACERGESFLVPFDSIEEIYESREKRKSIIVTFPIAFGVPVMIASLGVGDCHAEFTQRLFNHLEDEGLSQSANALFVGSSSGCVNYFVVSDSTLLELSHFSSTAINGSSSLLLHTEFEIFPLEFVVMSERILSVSFINLRSLPPEELCTHICVVDNAGGVYMKGVSRSNPSKQNEASFYSVEDGYFAIKKSGFRECFFSIWGGLFIICSGGELSIFSLSVNSDTAEVSLGEEVNTIASSEYNINSILCSNGVICLSYMIPVIGAQKRVTFLQIPSETRQYSVDKRSVGEIRRLFTGAYPPADGAFASFQESHGVIMRNELEKRCSLSLQEDTLITEINSLDLHLWQLATVVDALQSNLLGSKTSKFLSKFDISSSACITSSSDTSVLVRIISSEKNICSAINGRTLVISVNSCKNSCEVCQLSTSVTLKFSEEDQKFVFQTKFLIEFDVLSAYEITCFVSFDLPHFLDSLPLIYIGKSRINLESIILARKTDIEGNLSTNDYILNSHLPRGNILKSDLQEQLTSFECEFNDLRGKSHKTDIRHQSLLPRFIHSDNWHKTHNVAPLRIRYSTNKTKFSEQSLKAFGIEDLGTQSISIRGSSRELLTAIHAEAMRKTKTIIDENKLSSVSEKSSETVFCEADLFSLPGDLQKLYAECTQMLFEVIHGNSGACMMNSVDRVWEIYCRLRAGYI